MFNLLKYSWPLAVFMIWGWSFPNEGFLLRGTDAPYLSLFFLITGTISFFLLAILTGPKNFPRISLAAVGLTTLVTALFPFYPGYSLPLIMLLGFSGSFLAVRGFLVAKQSPRPLITFVIVVVLARIGILTLMYLPLADRFKFIILVAILASSLAPSISSPQQEGGTRKDYKIYLPLLFSVYFIFGVTVFLVKHHFDKIETAAGLQGLGGSLGAGVGYWLSKRNEEYPFFVGMLLSLLAFSLYLVNSPLMVKISIFTLGLTGGIVFVPIAKIWVEHQEAVKAVGYSHALIGLAFVSSLFFSLYFHERLPSIIAAANFLLVLSVFIFYFWAKKRTEEIARADAIIEDPNNLSWEKFLEEKFRRKLSAKEQTVLALVLEGKTYKETALELSLSESTVKTYMRRICEKQGVYGKQGLIEKLSSSLPEN